MPRRIFLLLHFVVYHGVYASFAQTPAALQHTLWYTQPAQNWNRTSVPITDSRLTKAVGINPNKLFLRENIKQTLVSPEAKIAVPSLPMVYVYDLQTEKGKQYIFNFRY